MKPARKGTYDRIADRLRRHAENMAAIEQSGMSRKEASEEALAAIQHQSIIKDTEECDSCGREFRPWKEDHRPGSFVICPLCIWLGWPFGRENEVSE